VQCVASVFQHSTSLHVCVSLALTDYFDLNQKNDVSHMLVIILWLLFVKVSHGPPSFA
jgi:hypothetical protein